MGTFRQPPFPHIGGSQPLESRKLPPSIIAVPEDNPPFGVPNPIWIILASWEPGVTKRQVIVNAIIVSEAPEAEAGKRSTWTQAYPVFIRAVQSRGKK